MFRLNSVKPAQPPLGWACEEPAGDGDGDGEGEALTELDDEVDTQIVAGKSEAAADAGGAEELHSGMTTTAPLAPLLPTPLI